MPDHAKSELGQNLTRPARTAEATRNANCTAQQLRSVNSATPGLTRGDQKPATKYEGSRQKAQRRTTSAERAQDGKNFEEWCGWRDLNPHALRHQNLNLACLPISPHPRRNKWQTTLRLKRGLYSIADFPVKGKSSALPHRKSDFSTSARSAGFRALSRSSAISPARPRSLLRHVARRPLQPPRSRKHPAQADQLQFRQAHHQTRLLQAMEVRCN